MGDGVRPQDLRHHGRIGIFFLISQQVNPLDQNVSNFNEHSNDLGDLVQRQILTQEKSRMGSEILYF